MLPLSQAVIVPLCFTHNTLYHSYISVFVGLSPMVRGLQLIRICLPPPTPRHLGGHLTGSVARRSTFFIFRIPLWWPRWDSNPHAFAPDFESGKSTNSITRPYGGFLEAPRNLSLKRIPRACTPLSAASLDNSHIRAGRCHHHTPVYC